MEPASIWETLACVLPAESFSLEAEVLDSHGRDATEDLYARPDVVVTPRSEEEVIRLLRGDASPGPPARGDLRQRFRLAGSVGVEGRPSKSCDEPHVVILTEAAT